MAWPLDNPWKRGRGRPAAEPPEVEISLKSLSTFARCHQSWLQSYWSVDFSTSWGGGHYHRYLHFTQPTGKTFSRTRSPPALSQLMKSFDEFAIMLFFFWQVVYTFNFSARVSAFHHILFTIFKPWSAFSWDQKKWVKFFCKLFFIYFLSQELQVLL